MPTENRVYIASKLGRMEPIVSDLQVKLEAIGFTIIYDWTEHFVPKPFEENISRATEAAEAMAQAVMQCDILIVLYAEDGIGFHIETGGALIASIILSYITGQKRKQIFVVGNGNDRSVFYFHHSVIRIPDIDTLLNLLSSRAPSL